MKESILFIGGQEDGLYHKVPDYMQHVAKPKAVKPVVGVNYATETKIEYVSYTRRQFSHGFQFFVEDSIKSQDVFAMLVEGYRRNDDMLAKLKEVEAYLPPGWMWTEIHHLICKVEGTQPA